MPPVATLGIGSLAARLAARLSSGALDAARVVAFASDDRDRPAAIDTLRAALPRLPATATLLVLDDALVGVALDAFPRVVGLGTVAEAARFRANLAARLRVDARDVHAQIVGTRDAPVPLWSTAAIAGVPLSQWAVPGHGKLSVRDRVPIFLDARQVDDAARLDAVADVLAAMNADVPRVLPIATRVPAGTYGIDRAATLALPCLVGAGEVTPLVVPTNDAELAGLRHAAEVSSS